MKNKGLIVSLLLMLALVVSGATYAYWAGTVTGNNDNAVGTITIGEGGTVTTTVSVDDLGLADQDLVPVGFAGNNDFDLSFSVVWTGAAGSAGATGALAVDSVTLSGLGDLTDTEIKAMFSVDVVSGEGTVTVGDTTTVVINIEFTNQPANQSVYNKVANGTLTVTVVFSVTP
jgi:hypothetical protein